MGGQALRLQQVGQRLGVRPGIVLIGALTGAEDQAVLLGLGQCQLVGDAVLLQVEQGAAAQRQIIGLAAPEAAQIVDAAHAHGTGKQVRAAQAAVHGLIRAQVHTGAPDPGALLGAVQGQDAGSQLGGQVDEILFLGGGTVPQGGVSVQNGFAVDAVRAEQLDLALIQQLGDGIGHSVVLPIVEAAAACRQRQHRHTGGAVHLELHVAFEHAAPFLVIGTLHHNQSALL